jgi:hypothetical protein
MANYVVLAVDKKGGPALMGFAETDKEAVELRDRATRAGWDKATICDTAGRSAVDLPPPT